jgi:alpha/beta superfamily hydrolase
VDEPVRTIDDIVLTASDGTVVHGDLTVPPDPRAAAIVCHPHPQYGGTRRDHVVGALYGLLPHLGIAALRFDFRSRFDGGRGERLDAEAALGELRAHVPGVPLLAVGYSFGAMIALGVATGSQGADDSVTAVVAVAAPLTMAGDAVPRPTIPTLLIVPAHDQFCDPEAARTAVADWPDVDVATVEMADHFLQGRTGAVAEAAAAWLDELLVRP